jgi:L-ascorbate metabolism protein UlaG (beta-lactamase superfamily)
MQKTVLETLALACLVSVLGACAASNLHVGKSSPSFKNGVFENRSGVQMKTMWEMFKAGIRGDFKRAQWPEWIETRSDLQPHERVNGSAVRITFINHATFLIQTGGFNILTDPVFAERTSPVSFIGPRRIHQPGIAMSDLPPIDIVLISHDHYDHLDLDAIKQLMQRDKPQIYMGLGVAKRLPASEHLVEMDWWQSAEVAEDLKLWFLDVQHFSGRSLGDRNTTLWGGFLLETASKKIYFGGDSGYADHYQRTYQHFGPIDIAFLPIGSYAPRELFKSVHLNPSEAVQAHVDLHADLSIGMHYGTFQLSAEPLSQPLELLEKAKLAAGVSQAAFITLDIGVAQDIDLAQADDN